MPDETTQARDQLKATPWLELITDAEKAFKTYQEKCDRIEKLYADLTKLAGDAREREFQIFWANLGVLLPSIYARPPVPVVTARFKDRKEIVRHASEMLERTLVTSFDIEDIHSTMKLIRDDVGLCARGAMWLRLESDDNGERVKFDHVDRRDFLHDPARKWMEVGWVARRSWLTREKMRERFEAASGDTYLKAEFKERNTSKEDEFKGEKKAAVWELWSREKNIVVWVTPEVEDVLDRQEPFLELQDFFPCPKPAYGTVKPGSLKPVPDMLYYKDQIEEINELTARISALSEALRVKGFYAGGNGDLADTIERALKSQSNNAIMIPVPNFAALGGAKLADAIVWLPLEVVAQTVLQLIQLRRQIIDDVFQITGISDIMRGSTDANETLGAQQLKSQFGAIRIRDRQEEMIRIARDATRIAGEIIAENFQPQTVLAMSQYDKAPPAEAIQRQIAQIQQQVIGATQNPAIVQQAQQNPEAAQQALQQAQEQVQTLQNTVTLEQVFEFLQDERMRPFVLDIETDSTIQPDENAQKQRVTEFLGALAQALAQLAPMVQAQPESAPFAAEVLKFAVAPFRAGRELQSAIDEFTEQVKKVAAQPQPNVQEEVARIEAQTKGQLAQAEIRAKQAELGFKEIELDLKIAESGNKAEIDQLKLEIDKDRQELETLRAEIELVRLGREQAEPATVN